MKKYLTLFMVFFTMMAFATTSKINITVKGMVCGFCAQGIEKKFKAREEVEGIDVSLKDKSVVLQMKEGKNIGDEEIKKILIDSGFNVEKIDRN